MVGAVFADRFIPLPAALALCLACMPKPYRTTFKDQHLDLRNQRELTLHGVTIGLDPITRGNVESTDLATHAYWGEPDVSAPVGLGASTRMIMRHGVIRLVPLPAFAVEIRNNTSQEVSFSAAGVEVTDETKHQYSLLTSSQDLRRRLDAAYEISDPGLREKMMVQVGQLSLFGSEIVVPPGKTWRGFLILDVNTRNDSDYWELMSSVQNFLVTLRRGSPTAGPGDDFRFLIDRSEHPLPLLCPGTVREPSPDRCTIQG
jgi:hypothetical protein